MLYVLAVRKLDSNFGLVWLLLFCVCIYVYVCSFPWRNIGWKWAKQNCTWAKKWVCLSRCFIYIVHKTFSKHQFCCCCCCLSYFFLLKKHQKVMLFSCKWKRNQKKKLRRRWKKVRKEKTLFIHVAVLCIVCKNAYENRKKKTISLTSSSSCSGSCSIIPLVSYIFISTA